MMNTSTSGGAKSVPVPPKHLVLAILSLAANEGQTRIPVVDLFKIFADLTSDFPKVLPFAFTCTGYTVYSKRLDDALQSLIGYSVNLPNPQLQYLEVTPEVARRHLDRLTKRYTPQFIEKMAPVAREFVAKATRTGGS